MRSEDEGKSMNDDLEHLRLLSIFHYIVGGLAGLCRCIPVIHLAMGIAMVSGSFDQSGSAAPPPQWIGWMFIVLGGGAIVIGWTFAIGLMLAGRFLQRRIHYTFCVVM